MSRSLRLIAVLAGWTVTSMACAALLVFMENTLGFSLYRFMFWFIIPAGAIASGFLAASGYYLAARLTHFRPRGSVGLLSLATSVFFYLLLTGLEFSTRTFHGLPLSHWISYPKFVSYGLLHAHMSTVGFVGFGSANIGFAGLFLTLFQILGFSVGLMSMAGRLKGRSYCEECDLYLKGTFNQARYFDWNDDLKKSSYVVLQKLRAGAFQDSIRIHAATGSPRQQSSTDYTSAFHVQRCKRCTNGVLTFLSQEKNEKKWTPIPDLSYAVKLHGDEAA